MRKSYEKALPSKKSAFLHVEREQRAILTNDFQKADVNINSNKKTQ